MLGDMTITPQFMHRRSLTLVSIILVLSLLVGPGFLPAFTKRLQPIDATLLLSAGVATVVLFFLCCIALINLIRDVERGYSPSRCSLSALLLLFAFVSPVALAIEVIRHL